MPDLEKLTSSERTALTGGAGASQALRRSSSPQKSEISGDPDSAGKAVLGTLYSVHMEAIGPYGHNERLTRICDTLENADYLVPEMIYRVQVTQSPKFGRLLPILEQVPGRSGIRFHRGTRPEHSKGCILLPPKMEALVTNQLLTAQKAHEEIRFDITHLRPGDRLPGMQSA